MLKEDFVEQEAQGRYYSLRRGHELFPGKFCMMKQKYFDEKPGQCRCDTCGNIFLWLSMPKHWELASGQIANPLEACAPLRQQRYSSKYVPPTYGKSCYYFNGKPIDCSLCTAVACVDCARVFPWGDQFRRDVCPCGGMVGVQHTSTPDPERQVFVRQFERRCRCCGDVEKLGGLEYLSYDDPGPESGPRVWGGNERRNPGLPYDRQYDNACFEYEIATYRIKSHFRCLSGHVSMSGDGSYSLPDEYRDVLRECRGMFFPHALCQPCQRGQGRAMFSVYTVPMDWDRRSRS